MPRRCGVTWPVFYSDQVTYRCNVFTACAVGFQGFMIQVKRVEIRKKWFPFYWCFFTVRKIFCVLKGGTEHKSCAAIINTLPCSRQDIFLFASVVKAVCFCWCWCQVGILVIYHIDFIKLLGSRTSKSDAFISSHGKDFLAWKWTVVWILARFDRIHERSLLFLLRTP